MWYCLFHYVTTNLNIIIIIYLYSLKTWHEYYKQCYTKNLHTMMFLINQHNSSTCIRHRTKQSNSLSLSDIKMLLPGVLVSIRCAHFNPVCSFQSGVLVSIPCARCAECARSTQCASSARCTRCGGSSRLYPVCLQCSLLLILTFFDNKSMYVTRLPHIEHDSLPL